MSETIWLTQEAYKRLQAELEDRTTNERSAIARRIDEARSEGDLKENGGYHAAREAQSMNETRIVQLEALLRKAEVGETPADDGVIEPGMLVTARLAGEEIQFLLGSREAGVGIEVDVFSPDAPMGKALLGHQAGETVAYKAPNGRMINIEIIAAVPFQN